MALHDVHTKELVVIEDDDDDRYLIRSVLEDHEHSLQVTEYSDAQQAYQSLVERVSLNRPLPDLVLLDLNMPGYDGFDFLHEARQLPTLCAVPIVVYTTSSAQSDLIKSYELGANAYMVKPLSYAEIKDMFDATVHYWLRVVYSTTIVGSSDATRYGIQHG